MNFRSMVFSFVVIALAEEVPKTNRHPVITAMNDYIYLWFSVFLFTGKVTKNARNICRLAGKKLFLQEI